MSMLAGWPTCLTCGRTVETVETKVLDGRRVFIVTCHGRSESFEGTLGSQGWSIGVAEVFPLPPQTEIN